MIGLLVMAYGGPDKIEDVEPYLLDVRGYRETPQAVIHEVRDRYREIGGRSPILEQTQAQANALEMALNDGPDKNYKVYVGMRHWHPYIQETLLEMRSQGIEKAVGLVMAPQFSRLSIQAYYNRVEQAGVDMQIARIEDWHLMPGYLDALAERVQEAILRFPYEERAQTLVLFSAHSLPLRILSWGDPYPQQLQTTVMAMMERLGTQPHDFAYQSAAISEEPWLGPDVSQKMEEYAAKGVKNILICPIGFVCEHVEILYDIDIVYQKFAKKLGLNLKRIEMLNCHPKMIEGLAELVRLTAKNWGPEILTNK